MNQYPFKSVYLAGPMTGIPQFNFPAFIKAAEAIRKEGITVVSPAEIDNQETREAAMSSSDGAVGSGSANGETWGDFLARDVKIVADQVDAVALLDGWQKSRGALLEIFTAMLCGKKIYSYTYPNGFVKMSAYKLLNAIVDKVSR